jgi:hypothetical protein
LARASPDDEVEDVLGVRLRVLAGDVRPAVVLVAVGRSRVPLDILQPHVEEAGVL